MKLETITEGLKQLLEQNNYSPQTIKMYQREWGKVQSFLIEEYGDTEFSMERGIAFLEKQYHIVEMAKSHTLTQSKVQRIRVIHMLEAGINIVYIRDFLGHVSTTMIYLRADNRLKDDAINKLAPKIAGDVTLPDWTKNPDLMSFLNSLK